MLRLLRILWWRIRIVIWHLQWRIEFGLGKWRKIYGIKVGLASVLDERVETRSFEMVAAALNLIAEFDPHRMSRITRDIPRIWIQRAGYAPAYYFEALRVCVLDRNYVTADETPSSMIAVAIVHEATHARLAMRRILYTEPMRARIEAICDAQSAEFARRLPDGEALAHRILEGRPTDAAHWSDANLDRRLLEAKDIELDDMRQELENAELPAWIKKMLRRMIRSRAA